MTSSIFAVSKPSSVGAAYCVIFSGVVAALQIGKLPPALPELSQTLGLSLMQAGFLLSLVQLAGMTLALAVGLSADGLGLKRSMLAGLFVLGLASALGATAESAQALMVWRAIEGVGFLWVTLPAPGLIRKLISEQHLRKLLGYWGAYMPAGTAPFGCQSLAGEPGGFCLLFCHGPWPLFCGVWYLPMFFPLRLNRQFTMLL